MPSSDLAVMFNSRPPLLQVALCAGHRFAGGDNLERTGCLPGQRFLEAHRPLPVAGTAVVTHANLRIGGYLRSQLGGGAQRLTVGDDAVGKADAMRLLRIHGTARKDHVERPAVPDQAWQPAGAAGAT